MLTTTKVSAGLAQAEAPVFFRFQELKPTCAAGPDLHTACRIGQLQVNAAQADDQLESRKSS